MTYDHLLRRRGIPYDLLISLSRARAERIRALSSGTWRLTMNDTPPRDPTQVPDGDLSDAVKNDNPTPSDFNDDEEDDGGFDDEMDEDDETDDETDDD